MIQITLRVIKFAIQNFLRNFWLSLATLTIIAITLFFVNVIVSVNQIKVAILDSFERQIDISLDFKQSIAEPEVMNAKRDLESDKRVTAITVVTPQENLDKFKKRYPKIGERVLPVLDSNPLGYTLRIKLADLDNYPRMLEEIKEDQQLSEKLQQSDFNDYRSMTSKAAEYSEKINTGAIALAGIFLVIALIIIFNTIRVSIYTHRDEIAIMRLVGATNWFIRTPFIIESVLYSFIAVAVVALVSFGILYVMQPQLSKFLGDFLNLDLLRYYQVNFWMIFGVQFAIVALLNAFSSSIALRRYLRM